MPPPTAASHPNHLLAALPERDLRRLLAASETIDLKFGQSLGEPHDRLSHAYFPSAGFISLIAVVDADSTLEVGMVGCEGMVGLPLLLGVNTGTLRSVVQGAGPCLRIAAEPFLQQLADSRPLQDLLRRYAAVVLAQHGQLAACTRFHLLEQRLARWLMLTHDRAGHGSFYLTHEFLSAMLGVRRVGITEAAKAMQGRGLISYTRGEITILDRPGLERAACSCYRADLDVYAGFMHGWESGAPCAPDASGRRIGR